MSLRNPKHSKQGGISDVASVVLVLLLAFWGLLSWPCPWTWVTLSLCAAATALIEKLTPSNCAL